MFNKMSLILIPLLLVALTSCWDSKAENKAEDVVERVQEKRWR